MTTDPLALRITAVFNRCFGASHRTIMRGGGEEPLYLPATTKRCAEVVFTHDYPASALHEAAHWCIASALRRLERDYGYFYVPPPRSAIDQDRFLRAEARNQGLESVFADAMGLRFHPSFDLLDVDPAMRDEFESAVRMHAERYREEGLRPRAARFERALVSEFRA